MSSARPRDHIVLAGMMGSGKSSVAVALGARLGRPVIDTDQLVEARVGCSVAELFASRGEDAFRAEEADAVREALETEQPAIVSLGGGAVVTMANRELLRAGTAQVVFLRASVETLVARVEAAAAKRPLLGTDAPEALERLELERQPYYAALADTTVDVDGRSLAAVVDDVALKVVRRVPYLLGERSYEVLVGPGALAALASVLPTSAQRCIVVSQEGIDVELDTGIPTTRVDIGPGEAAKTFTTIGALCERFAELGLTRGDVIIGLGGGVVTDVAGFAASCYHRGTPVVHVSTSLLGQVDAALGGKTGVNLRAGKNLAGAFWQPSGVICDTDTLSSLSEREWRSGLGEMAKYAFLGVDELDVLPLTEQVARCAAVKAAFVAGDEREAGQRALLNYGHTLGHALEALGLGEARHSGDGNLDLRHGEAVAIGLVFAARLAERLGRIDEERVARHVAIVEAYGLPSAIPAGLNTEILLAQMARDKKAIGGLTFVLDGPGGLEVVRDVPAAAVREALAHSVAVAERAGAAQ